MYKILVKRLRRKRRISQKVLARKSGLSESYISRLEADNAIRDRTPTLQSLEAIAISLNVCVRDMVIYPCVQCQIHSICEKEKDMREPNEIIKEILDYYV